MSFWTSIDSAIWISIFLCIPIVFNFFNVRRYGEIEFWLTTIKIGTIVGLIILGILLAMGCGPGPLLSGTDSHYRPVPCIENVNAIGPCVSPPVITQLPFKSLFAPGAAGRLAAIWNCCLLSIFSYTGCENIGITADETEYQRRTLPKATKRVAHRLMLYYVGATIALGINLSPNDPILALPSTKNAQFYPGGFIVMIQRAGIPVLPDIVNGVMIIAALSVANADLYVTVRPSLFRYLYFRVDVSTHFQKKITDPHGFPGQIATKPHI